MPPRSVLVEKTQGPSPELENGTEFGVILPCFHMEEEFVNRSGGRRERECVSVCVCVCVCVCMNLLGGVKI